jgi:hypothetical protein
MHQRCSFAIITAILLLGQGLLGLRAWCQQKANLRETQKYVTGIVRSFSNGVIALAQARDARSQGSPSADITFVITTDTAFPNRDFVRVNTSVMVGYVEQNGKLIARTVAFLGFSNGTAAPSGSRQPIPSQNPYTTIPGHPGSPTPPYSPARPAGGGCPNSAGPCMATPGPQLLPAGTGHDFNSVWRQADVLAKDHPGAKIYTIHLNYMNDAVWQAEFDYVTEPSGRGRNSRWGDCRVYIDPARGNVSQYQAVIEYTDQFDDPPPLAPANLAPPWGAMRSMNIPARIRQSEGGIKIDLGEVGATHRLTMPTGPTDYLKVIARSVGQGQWVWAASWPFPTNPNTGTVFQIIYADAVTGRATSECANMPGMNPDNWTLITCPPAYEPPKRPHVR